MGIGLGFNCATKPFDAKKMKLKWHLPKRSLNLILKSLTSGYVIQKSYVRDNLDLPLPII
jgi:hypothetical protein